MRNGDVDGKVDGMCYGPLFTEDESGGSLSFGGESGKGSCRVS